MAQPQYIVPAGLIDILREASAIINNTIEKVPADQLPVNIRFPIVDELDGFACMLEHEASIFKQAVEAERDAPGTSSAPIHDRVRLQEPVLLTEKDTKAMREVLKRIYIGRYHERLSSRLCDSDMAELAKPYVALSFDQQSPEHQALLSIYFGRCCAIADDRLTDTEMAEIAKPFVNLEEVHAQIQRDMDAAFEAAEAPVQLSVFEEPASAAPTLSRNAAVAAALKPFLGPNDKAIWVEPFRWFDENGVLSNHFEGMSVQALAEEFGYEIIADYNEVAIVRIHR